MRNRTSKEMYPLITKWRKSGKSQKVFCEEVQIKHHVFKYWVNKRNKERQEEESPSDFIELAIEQPRPLSKSNILFAEIAYASGAALRLYQPLASEDLKILVQGLS